MFERFTDQARQVIVLAQEEARLLEQDFVGTEHLLLGLLREGDGVAARALELLGVSLEAARAKVEQSVTERAAVNDPQPFTPRAKKTLELCLREALQLGHNYIGTEHILLGLVQEGSGLGAQVLIDQGVDLTTARAMVLSLLAGSSSAEPAPSRDPLLADPGDSTVRSGPVPSAPSDLPPSCPHCRTPLERSARLRRLDLVGEADGEDHAFSVVYCSVCGQSLAFKPID
jgi:ATP-dependent Clp protease ATP-binding subunit ClpC